MTILLRWKKLTVETTVHCGIGVQSGGGRAEVCRGKPGWFSYFEPRSSWAPVCVIFCNKDLTAARIWHIMSALRKVWKGLLPKPLYAEKHPSARMICTYIVMGEDMVERKPVTVFLGGGGQGKWTLSFCLPSSPVRASFFQMWERQRVFLAQTPFG